MLSAIAASTGGTGTRTTPRALSASVTECASVKPVIVTQDAAPRPGDEQKAHREQKMVVALEDVPDAQSEVVACDTAEALSLRE